MTRAIAATALVSSLAFAPIGCATSNTQSAQTTAPKSGLLGRAEQYAGVALSAAKSFLAKTPPQQQPDKNAAAQAGVAAANTQAKQEQGSALSQVEQQALVDWVKARI